MNMYHRKQDDKKPSDRKETSKLLSREEAVHKNKKLAKDAQHVPHHKDKPTKKAKK
jgi:hypothetical protein